MIIWTDITDSQPSQGEWVLATYFMEGKWNCWRTRIYQWSSNKHSNRKITHWCYINPPN